MSEHTSRIRYLRGTPFEIGYAMGRSLGPRLEADFRRYVQERRPSGSSSGSWPTTASRRGTGTL